MPLKWHATDFASFFFFCLFLSEVEERVIYFLLVETLTEEGRRWFLLTWLFCTPKLDQTVRNLAAEKHVSFCLTVKPIRDD